ncbi:MAG: hypothetical protein JWL63_1054 [Rhodocyclales bacterium]|nr:hypothetical protein [Rhodocyclales bacterium]
MLLFSLALALAFWQDQRAEPQRQHEAEVAAHSRALFAHMQDEFQLADRLLHALDLAAPLQDAGDINAFARLAKTLGPGFRRMQTVALAQVVSASDDTQQVRLFSLGDTLDKQAAQASGMPRETTAHMAATPEALTRLAGTAARDARSSGRLTLTGPLAAGNIQVLAIARANREGTVNIALIDVDKWLEAEQSQHAAWIHASLEVINDKPAQEKSAAHTDDGEKVRFSFEDLGPQVQLLVTPLPLEQAQPPTIVGAAGIALFGVMISGLILLLGTRGNQAAAAANLVGRALTESDERLQRALQLTQDGIWEYDLTRRTLYLSGQALALIGWQHQQHAASKQPSRGAVLRALPRQWRREVLRTIIDAAGKTATRELKFPVSDAMLSSRWMRLRVRGTCDAAGNPWLITGSVADISEEISHASAQDRYRALLMRVLDAMPIPVAVKTADHKAVMLNERYATQLMEPLEEVMRRFDDGTGADVAFAARMEELDQMAIATGEPQVAHEWLKTSDGEELYLRITRVLCDGLNGEPIVLGTYEDLTELQRQAQQQSALREYFERVFDSLPSPTYIKDADHRYILTNQAHARANGTTKETMIGKRSADFSPDEAEEIEAAERHLLSAASEEIHEKEYSLNYGGKPRNTVIRKVRITDPAGKPVLLGISSDVTSLREAEEDLRQQAEQQSRLRNFLQDVFDAVPHPLFVKDRQCRYIMTNRAHSESVGASMQEIIGKRSADFVSGSVADVIEQAEEALFTGASSASAEAEYVLPHHSGETRHTIIRKAICTGADGHSVLVGVNTDITQLREAEEGLRRHRDQLSELVREQTIDLVHAKEVAERANETKSAFLANMSHELRTPLHAILSFARLGESRVDRLDVEKLQGYFNRIRISGDRLLIMLNDLLDLSKLEAGRIALDMHATYIENTAQESAREFEAWLTARRLELTINIEPELPRIMVDAAKIGQVLRNLLSNAIKFSPENGRITLTLRNCTLVTRGDAVPAVELCVADEGTGIPEEELETVFEKFVQSSSNPRESGGTGLGLAISREIVVAHGGHIFARNRKEGGAEFVVHLRVDRRASRTREDEPETQGAGEN